jgi:hypothetical protein
VQRRTVEVVPRLFAVDGLDDLHDATARIREVVIYSRIYNIIYPSYSFSDSVLVTESVPSIARTDLFLVPTVNGSLQRPVIVSGASLWHTECFHHMQAMWPCHVPSVHL